MKTGFIGLGNLGRAMAGRLISEGVDLVVWNRTLKKAQGLKAVVASHPADLITKSDIVFLNLFDSAAVSEVFSGDNGLLAGACKGKIVVDTTTNHFEAVPLFYTLLHNAGAEYLEAPVLGSVIPASKGALTFLVGGSQAAFDKTRPILEKLAQHIFYLEKPTLAARMKLVNNLVLGSFMATIAEAVVFAEASGIDRAKVLDILAAGAGNSSVLNAKKTKLLDGDYSPHFSVNAIYKDLHYLQDLAEELKRPLFMGGLARELFGMARARGLEDSDFSVIHQVLSDLK
jgi:3-hydroxyisobutyrate dehydrogenase